MKKADVKDIESLEVYYNTTRKIRFAEDVEIESFEDIYNNLFNRSMYVRENLQKPTFFMRGAAHCPSGKYRSIEDFVKLCKKYFPNKTLKDIFSFLKEKQDSLDKEGFRQYLGYCPNIRKYNYRGVQPKTSYSSDIDKYNLEDLSPLVNITVSELLT